jgi:Uma2 family endonuclease
MSQEVEAKPKVGRVWSRRIIKLAVPSSVRLRISDKDFWKLCAENPDLRLERTEKGIVEIMSPTSGATGNRNADLTAQLMNWSKIDRTGLAFDSSTGFRLPNGATRAPDASWVRKERWECLTTKEKEETFVPLCPDFAIELRSRSDEKKDRKKEKVRDKMREYITQGAKLGWLIDPIDGTVEIYRPGRPVETLEKAATLSGEDVLPGFVLELKGILFD